MDVYSILRQSEKLRISNGAIAPILEDCESANSLLIIIWSQLGDFDTLEYAWWLHKEWQSLVEKNIVVRAIGIGNLDSGLKFADYTGFPKECLFVDPEAKIHQQLGLYRGLSWQLPFFSTSQNAWLNLLLMCAGIGSPGTLKEVFRGYLGDRASPQLIEDDLVVRALPFLPISGSFFKLAGGKGFQRPFELATLRLKNMTEVLGNWKTYVPQEDYLTQRGATFLFDRDRSLIYEHRERGILGFAANMSRPLSFLL